MKTANVIKKATIWKLKVPSWSEHKTTIFCWMVLAVKATMKCFSLSLVVCLYTKDICGQGLRTPGTNLLEAVTHSLWGKFNVPFSTGEPN